MGPPDTGPRLSQDAAPKKTAVQSEYPESPSTLPVKASDPKLAQPLATPASATAELARPAEDRSHEPPDAAPKVPTTLGGSIQDDPGPTNAVEPIDDVIESDLPSPASQSVKRPPTNMRRRTSHQSRLGPNRRSAERDSSSPCVRSSGQSLAHSTRHGQRPPADRLAGGSYALRSPHRPDGAIASELKSVLARFPSPDSLARTDDARDLYVVLALAATLRPTLLSPDTGATLCSPPYNPPNDWQPSSNSRKRSLARVAVSKVYASIPR